ncbi:hypothetical protein QBC37DRAFT_373487 [Rhypophila decipiens]|uniref:Uncharacterized protein n=1 Tax=Rhypophila decipiens TaxID=261697 RepID=A0AAN7B7Q9_9PEZI|nr:hypothetical protein QBC37DRAFT_373487 [Rhypophila decipiens]
MRCSVITLYLDSPDFKDKLKKFVDKRFKKPRIIYISCHGSDRDGAEGLKFSSGGDRKVYAERSWSDIVEIVVPAKVDVLFIIDCCHAGKACISHQGTGIRYAKEVIACWFTNKLKTNLTARKLYEYINASVRYKRDAAELWDKEYYTQPIFSQEHDDWVSEATGSSKDGKIMSVKKARRWKLAMPKSELPTQETAMTKDVEKLFRLLNLNPESKDDSEEDILDKAPMENTKKLPCRRKKPEKERSYRTMRSQKKSQAGRGFI